MFKVVKERLVWWPVVWDVPVDGGKVEQAEFKVRFRLIDISDLNKWLRDIDQEQANEREFVDQCVDIVKRIATDWEGVVDADDKAIEFSDPGIRTLMSVPAVFSAIINAYRGCLAGLPETRAKN